MAKGEIRKGKWGILGDGFFAQLSASGDPPGPLYNSANIKLQQGMVELALAYRIIDDRRGFLDIYAGARYKYFGIDIDASIDDSDIRNVSDDASQRIFSAIGTRVQSAVDADVQKLRAELGNEEAILEDDARNRIAAGLESDLQTRLRRELAGSHPLRDAFRDADVLRIARGLRGEYRAFLNAVLDERLAQARARLDAREAQAVANAQARVAQAEKKLSKALSKELENRLPTSRSGDQWWVDPIIGLHTQINFTRLLFLALQGDVGGFGAGSQIAWFASGSIGINFHAQHFLGDRLPLLLHGLRQERPDLRCRAIRTFHGRRREILKKSCRQSNRGVLPRLERVACKMLKAGIEAAERACYRVQRRCQRADLPN